MRRISPGLVALALALAATAVAASAHAADMPLPPAPGYYPPAVLPPARYDWTGLYFGGQVGADLLKDSVTQATATPPTTLAGPTSIGPVGLIGGAQVGVNYEFAPWVIGAEASWAASNVTGSASTAVATTPPPPPMTAPTDHERATSAPAWFATATGRVGYAANDLLFYAKGGAAWMHVIYDQELLTAGRSTSKQSISDTRYGFTAGAGLEYGLTENLSARLEYDFFDFGAKTYNFVQTPVSIKSDVHVLTVGLNYRFTWAGGRPLVARY